MGRMKKVFDETYKKGAWTDDQLDEATRLQNKFTHKPTESESDLVNGDVGETSYYTITEKKFRIVVYVED